MRPRCKAAALVAVAFLAHHANAACDDAQWKEVKQRYDLCIQDNDLQDIKSINATDESFCGKLEALIECSELVDLCHDSHSSAILDELAALPLDGANWLDSLDACRTGRRLEKRSPGKNKGGDGGSSRGGSLVDRGRSAVAGILGGNKAGGGGLLGGGSKAGAVGAAGGAAKSGSTLKKVGKYAVAGLAAYGTYKLAKKMTKGLRSAYDDDDCWRYNLFRDEYECVCPGQCRVYAGAAAAVSAWPVLLAVCNVVVVLRHFLV